MKIFLLVLALALPGAALAQNSERGSVPPGESRDGGKPSDGAIQGGTILPGETGGRPDQRGKMKLRCEELTGTLREDCLRQERDAASGATIRRESLPEVEDSPPRTAPPQNPS